MPIFPFILLVNHWRKFHWYVERQSPHSSMFILLILKNDCHKELTRQVFLSVSILSMVIGREKQSSVIFRHSAIIVVCTKKYYTAYKK